MAKRSDVKSKRPTDTPARLITRYFHDVQKQACLPEQTFNSRTPFVEIPLAQLREGVLSPNITAEIFKKEKNNKTSSVSVIVSLVTAESEGKKWGLLLVPCSVDRAGTLSGSPSDGEPWIPAAWLDYPGNTNLTIGKLVDLWNFRTNFGVSQASRVDSWSDFLSYAISLFESVVGKKLHDWTTSFGVDSDQTINTETCYLVAGENIIANKAIVELYSVLEESLATNPVPLYEKFVSVQDFEQRLDADLSDHDTQVESMVKSCGHMGGKFPLTPSQRTALHAFLSDDDGDITAVSGPPGTGKTTMLQAVVANLVTRHALEGVDAPLILCTSTNNQAVTNIIDSFSSVGAQAQGGFDVRWIPAASGAKADATTEEPLHSLATYCPAVSKYDRAKSRGYLVDTSKKNGAYSDYSDPGYIKSATDYFQAQATTYLQPSAQGTAVSIASIQRVLKQQLEEVDRRRRQLIISFSDYSESPRPSQTIAQEYEHEAHQHTEHGRHAVTNRGQSLMKKLFRRSRSKARNTSDTVQPNITRAEIAGQELEKILAELRVTGIISTEQSQKIRNSRSLGELDEILDVTLRYHEFWLAVHYYEASWLLTAENNEFVPEEDRYQTIAKVMEKYWPQACALTPCFVMTTYQVPKYFSLWTGNRLYPLYSLSRADLLIVDEAGQIDTSIGASAFAFAKRAIVVGDERQLAPIWNIDPVTDEDLATGGESSSNNAGAYWDVMKKRGLTASQPSSVMKAASHAGNWAYSDPSKQPRPGLLLSEHFRCHSRIIGFCNELIYDGQLQPRRSEQNYRLADTVTNPFMFYRVPGTQDQTVGSSRVNREEADAIAHWIGDNYEFFETRYCGGDDDGEARLGKNGIIGVVTPFAAQATHIKRALHKHCPDIAHHITVGTAHSLQGAERPVIIFSSVYGETSERAAFIDNTLELMNVAVSRAKDLFIVVGCQARWKDQGSVFSLVRKYAQTPVDSPFVMGAAQESFDEEVLYEKSYWEEQGYLVASDMLRGWGSAVNPQELNKVLIRDGYLVRDDDLLRPTSRGAKEGIVAYRGEKSNGKSFVNVCYSPQAQELIRELYG
ncbi:DEAD/DEAH box helicase [Arcanobacterium pinnipediorum]|uniref:AAA domain-containing protein n=1 Tax=Arcanobacterium pinnipediorum TaxID=1503041 RepID=A0ABY5AFN5_9ACTO|nr:AAA domain-containing protein [Arcanobacterium pinnipediorum]USR79022.1 AAA domain-containing protein [Arcanobacterium pinnipediorum]